MKLFGLIGYPLSHTFSPGYFNEKFGKEHINAEYRPFPLEDLGRFPELLNTYPLLQGLNVTIPYKEKIIPYLDGLDKQAQDIGAVNCIRFNNGKLMGFNTDASGFRDTIAPLLQAHHKAALILGTGGASRAVRYILEQAGLQCLLVSRAQGKETIRYEELSSDILKKYNVIVNTTPVGMYPHQEEAPAIPYQYLTADHLLYDVIYNPAETLFLKKGRQQGAMIKNGYEMLVNQAEGSWLVWNGK